MRKKEGRYAGPLRSRCSGEARHLASFLKLCKRKHDSIFPFHLRGIPYMTSAVGGDWGESSPKSRQKKQNKLICDIDKGGGGQKIPKFCGRHIWKPPSHEHDETWKEISPSTAYPRHAPVAQLAAESIPLFWFLHSTPIEMSLPHLSGSV